MLSKEGFRLLCAVTKLCAFGSKGFRFCSVSDKFFILFRTSAINARFLAKVVLHGLESNQRNLAFSASCLFSSLEAS